MFMKNIILLLSLFFCFGKTIFAQDIHFSQFNASPINLNPALAGIFNGDYRFIGNQRSQWLSIPVPYKTYSFSGDMKLPFKLLNNELGVGITLNKDKSGTSDFNTSQAELSLSYIKKLNPDSTQLLSVGIQSGLISKNFNTSKLTFDNQYNGDQYDPSISSIENFSTTKLNCFDLSFGINYLYKITSRSYLNAGTALFHLNKPKESFLGNSSIKLDKKITQHIIYGFKANAVIDILPSVLFSKQGKFSELALGSSAKYLLQAQSGLGTALYFGTYYRLKDAIILSSGMDYNNITLGISYDINVSKLRAATNNRGGFEISVIYIFQKFVAIRSNKKICPVFL
jgi:type IX secretion system PorP/SprF family membrane protein